MSNENVAYTYQNVGVELDRGVDEAAAYTYQNVGLRAGSRVGAVYGLTARHLINVAYTYQYVTT